MEAVPAFLTYCLPLMGHVDRNYAACGTAVMIGPKIALTAFHNIPGLADLLGVDLERGPHDFGPIDLRGMQVFVDQPITNESGQSVRLGVVYAARSQFATDAAVLFLESGDRFEEHWTRSSMEVNVGLPVVGQAVAGFGFPDAEIQLREDEAGRVQTLTNSAVLAEGRVERLCEARPAGLRTFPSFEVDTIWPGGMSGGPIFQHGRVVGLVAAGVGYLPSDEHMNPLHTSQWPVPDHQPVSLGMMLWPLFGDEFSIPFICEGQPFGLFDLLAQREGLENYWVRGDPDPQFAIFRRPDGNGIRIVSDAVDMEVLRFAPLPTLDDLIRGRRG